MKICIVKLSALGDIVHALPTVTFIKKFLPNSKIDWIVEKRFEELLLGHPKIDNVYALEIKKIKSSLLQLKTEIRKIRQISRNNYDMVIDLQGLLKSAIISKMVCKNSFGFDKNSIREKAASFFYKHTFKIDYAQNVILRNLRLVAKSLNLEEKLSSFNIQQPHLFCHNQKKDISSQEIIFAIGSSWESKIYDEQRYINLALMLKKEITIIWGNEKELQMALNIQKKTKAKIANKMNLRELICAISNAKLLIGSDSGPTHMAWALRTPSIVIYGPTPHKRNTLEDNITKTVFAKEDIDPLNIDKNDFCIRKIDEKKIFEKAQELLNRSTNS